MTQVETVSAAVTGLHRVVKSSSLLVVRRVVIGLASAGSTAVVAHRFDIGSFGAYSAGLANFYIVINVCDFGFGATLVRELAVDWDRARQWYRAAVRVATAWSIGSSAVLVALGLTAGLETTRGQVAMILVPAAAINGMTVSRQLMMARLEVRRLALIDTVSNLLQAATLTGLALLHLPIVWLAVGTSATVVANVVWAWLASVRWLRVVLPPVVVARTRQGSGVTAARVGLGEFFRLSAPIGLVSLMASVYFMIDLTIDAYLVSPRQLALYAGPVKVLSMITMLPGLVMSVALPGMSQEADHGRSSSLVTGLAHWFVVCLLPCCVFGIIFRSTILDVLFGASYSEAGGVLSILLGAGIVGLGSIVFGTMLVAQRRSLAMVAQNITAITVNVVGNLVLVPRVGIVASAWLTLGTEVIVFVGSLSSVAGSVEWIAVGKLISRPVVILAVVATGAVVFRATSWPWLIVVPVLYLIATRVTGAWPRFGAEPIPGGSVGP